jgi:hypothetical protein
MKTIPDLTLQLWDWILALDSQIIAFSDQHIMELWLSSIVLVAIFKGDL